MVAVVVFTREPLSSSAHIEVVTLHGSIIDDQSITAWNDAITAMPPKTNFLADFTNLHGLSYLGVKAIRDGFQKITSEGGNFKIVTSKLVEGLIEFLSPQIPGVEIYDSKELALLTNWSQRGQNSVADPVPEEAKL